MRKKQIIFETAGGGEIGYGHITRCIALAKEALLRGWEIFFEDTDRYTKSLIRDVASKTEISFSAWWDYQQPDEDQIICRVIDTPDEEHPLLKAWQDDLKFAVVDKAFSDMAGLATPGIYPIPFICLGKAEEVVPTVVKFVEELDLAGFLGPATIVADSKYASRLKHLTEDWYETRVLSDLSPEQMAKEMVRCDIAVTKTGQLLLEAFCLGIGAITIEPTGGHDELHKKQQEKYGENWPTVCITHNRYHFRPNDIARMNPLTQVQEAAGTLIAKLENRPELTCMGYQAKKLVDGRGAERVLDAIEAEIESKGKTV
ncbi:MAG: hypothetical protein KKD77_22145 [Gammaproteobacteria bacterium]|nr:hypothetical protein [Gammaproteobacteria bacterium]